MVEMDGVTPADQFEQFRRYADRVTVNVRGLGEDRDPDQGHDWFVVTDGAPWDPDWLLRQVEALGYRHYGDEREPVYGLELTERRVEWGASAAVIQVVLQTMLAIGLEEGVRSLARVLAGKLRESGRPDEYSLDEDEAVNRARWLVTARYRVEDGALAVLSTSTREDGGASVALRDDAGNTYRCSMRLEEGLVLMAEVEREYAIGSGTTGPA